MTYNQYVKQLPINKDKCIAIYNKTYSNKIESSKLAELIDYYNEVALKAPYIWDNCYIIEDMQQVEMDRIQYVDEMLRVRGMFRTYVNKMSGIQLNSINKAIDDIKSSTDNIITLINVYNSYRLLTSLITNTLYKSRINIHGLVDQYKNGYKQLLDQLEIKLSKYKYNDLVEQIQSINENNIVLISIDINNSLKTNFTITVIILINILIANELNDISRLSNILKQEKVKFIQEFNGIIDSKDMLYFENITNITQIINYYLMQVLNITGKCEVGRWPNISITDEIYNILGNKPFVTPSMIKKTKLLGDNKIKNINILNSLNIELLRRVIVKYKTKLK